MTLVDTNVIFDILTDDKVWSSWSSRQLEIAAVAGKLVINDVIYAEVSVRYDTITALDKALWVLGTQLYRIPPPASFRPPRLTGYTGAAAAPGPAFCRISSLAPMRWCETSRC